jgi:hypothetical protein
LVKAAARNRILDMDAGEPEGFSLPAGPGAHFIIRSRVFGLEEREELGRGSG